MSEKQHVNRIAAFYPPLNEPDDTSIEVRMSLDELEKVFAEPEQRSKCLPVRRSAEAHPVALIA